MNGALSDVDTVCAFFSGEYFFFFFATGRIHHLVILFHLQGSEQLQQATAKLTFEKQSQSQLKMSSILLWRLKHCGSADPDTWAYWQTLVCGILSPHKANSLPKT